MPRGMDADAAMPMPGSGGSSVEREPGAAVCAPAPNFELLCVVYCMVSIYVKKINIENNTEWYQYTL